MSKRTYRLKPDNLTGAATSVPAMIRETADTELAASARHDGLDIHFRDSSDNVLPAKIGYRPVATPRGSAIWSWFTRPEAYHFNGVTYWAYYDLSDGSWNVASYNHTTKQKATKQLAVSDNADLDDHCGPSVGVGSDGTIYVACAEHNQTTLRLFVSDAAEDISAFTVRDHDALLLGVASYSQLEVLDGDILFLSWREGLTDRYFSTSADGGVTFSDGEVLYSNGSERPYIHQIASGTLVHVLASSGNAETMSDGDCDMFHYYYDHDDASFYESDGTLIGVAGAVEPGPGNATLIEDATTSGYNFWGAGIGIDAQGRPHVVYSQAVSDQNIRYRYARWDGAAWIINEITGSGETLAGPELIVATSGGDYVAGLAIAADASAVYAARAIGGQSLEMVRCTTDDGGTTWSIDKIANGNGLSVFRPAPVRNAHREVQVFYLVGDYTSWAHASDPLKVGECGIAAWPGNRYINDQAELTALVEVDVDGTSAVDIFMHWGTVEPVASPPPLVDAYWLSAGDVHFRTITDTTFLDEAVDATVVVAYKPDGIGVQQTVLSDWTSAADNGRHLLIRHNSSNQLVVIAEDTLASRTLTATDLAALAAWNALAVKVDSGTMSAAVNGDISSVTASITTSLVDSASGDESFQAGASPHDIAATNIMYGDLDLVAIYLAAKSDDWIVAATRYAAGNDIEALATLKQRTVVRESSLLGEIVEVDAGDVNTLAAGTEFANATFFEFDGITYAQLRRDPDAGSTMQLN